MTEANNNTNSPLTDDLAKRLIIEHQFCSEFKNSFLDEILDGRNSSSPIPSTVVSHVFLNLSTTLHLLLEQLHSAYPDQFSGYFSDTEKELCCDDDLEPQQYSATD